MRAEGRGPDIRQYYFNDNIIFRKYSGFNYENNTKIKKSPFAGIKNQYKNRDIFGFAEVDKKEMEYLTLNQDVNKVSQSSRSSRPEVFCCLLPATSLKKRLWHRCFPMNFVKFPRTPFFIEHFWCLLLIPLKIVRENIDIFRDLFCASFNSSITLMKFLKNHRYNMLFADITSLHKKG